MLRLSGPGAGVRDFVQRHVVTAALFTATTSHADVIGRADHRVEHMMEHSSRVWAQSASGGWQHFVNAEDAPHPCTPDAPAASADASGTTQVHQGSAPLRRHPTHSVPRDRPQRFGRGQSRRQYWESTTQRGHTAGGPPSRRQLSGQPARARRPPGSCDKTHRDGDAKRAQGELPGRGPDETADGRRNRILQGIRPMKHIDDDDETLASESQSSSAASRGRAAPVTLRRHCRLNGDTVVLAELWRATGHRWDYAQCPPGEGSLRSACCPDRVKWERALPHVLQELDLSLRDRSYAHVYVEVMAPKGLAPTGPPAGSWFPP
jgi:hypothetical protein